MNLAFHLRLAGVGLLVLAAAHLLFPAWLRWREELARLSLLNRQIFHVHTFFVCLVLAMMGALSAFGTTVLLTGGTLGRWVLGGFAGFWAARLICQWLVYDPSLWRGDRGRTAIHLFLTGVWTYLTVVYGTACWTLW